MDKQLANILSKKDFNPGPCREFEIKLFPPTHHAYPEFDFMELCKLQDGIRSSTNVAERKKLEQDLKTALRGKVGPKVVYHLEPTNHSGYDSEDSFVDNSEYGNDVVPAELDTNYQGFYVNMGPLSLEKDQTEVAQVQEPAKKEVSKRNTVQEVKPRITRKKRKETTEKDSNVAVNQEIICGSQDNILSSQDSNIEKTMPTMQPIRQTRRVSRKANKPTEKTMSPKVNAKSTGGELNKANRTAPEFTDSTVEKIQQIWEEAYQVFSTCYKETIRKFRQHHVIGYKKNLQDTVEKFIGINPSFRDSLIDLVLLTIRAHKHFNSARPPIDVVLETLERIVPSRPSSLFSNEDLLQYVVEICPDAVDLIRPPILPNFLEFANVGANYVIDESNPETVEKIVRWQKNYRSW